MSQASESRAFLQRGDLAKLPEALRDPAKKIFDWWITAVDEEIAADAATNANATTTTTSEGLGGSIFLQTASGGRLAIRDTSESQY